MDFTVKDIITLTEAGWEKEEIIRLATSKQPEPKPEPEKEEPKRPEPKAEDPKPEEDKAPEKSIEDLVSEKLEAAFKPYEELYTKMATLAGMPSISNVEPKGIDDIINKFFDK